VEAELRDITVLISSTLLKIEEALAEAVFIVISGTHLRAALARNRVGPFVLRDRLMTTYLYFFTSW
jgi:hypothetical protein